MISSRRSKICSMADVRVRPYLYFCSSNLNAAFPSRFLLRDLVLQPCFQTFDQQNSSSVYEKPFLIHTSDHEPLCEITNQVWFLKLCSLPGFWLSMVFQGHLSPSQWGCGFQRSRINYSSSYSVTVPPGVRQATERTVKDDWQGQDSETEKMIMGFSSFLMF